MEKSIVGREIQIFQNIRKGILPSDDDIAYILMNNNHVEEIDREDVQFFIKNTEESYLKSDNTSEKLLFNRVLFVLNSFIDKEFAIEDFLFKTMLLNFYDCLSIDGEYIEFILQYLSIDQIMVFLKKNISQIDKRDKIELRNFVSWFAFKIWSYETFFNDSKFLELESDFKTLLTHLIEQNRIDEVMYVEFITYHILSNSFQTIEEWREFNKNIVTPCARFYKKYISNLSLPKVKKNRSSNKQKIIFIRDRMVLNSPMKVEYSLIKALQEDENFRKNYDIAVVSMNYFEKAPEDPKVLELFSKINVPVFSPAQHLSQQGIYNSHLEKALLIRNFFIEHSVDIAVFCVGTYDVAEFLITSRVAPLQIYYSHGNGAFDIEGIDKRISHFEQECKEFEWNIFQVPIAEEFLIGTKEDKINGESIKKQFLEKYGKDTVILGTIGRLMKLESEEYLSVVAEIMRENLNTIYLACGVGNRESIEHLMEKVGIDLKRIIFTGQVNPHVYGWIIDVWLDTFPLFQGQSRVEYQAKNGSIVVLKKYYPQPSFEQMKKISKEMNAKNPIVETVEEYINFTNILVKNKNTREIQGRINKGWTNQKFDLDNFLKAIES